MALHKLMQLLPPTTLPVHLTTSEPGPPLMDSQNPVVKLFIKGHDVHGCIINGGSGINVISEATFHDLCITQWEPCPFWLRMVDTRSVRLIGLICNLEFILGGHTFTVSAIILRLDVLSAYSLFLGRVVVNS